MRQWQQTETTVHSLTQNTTTIGQQIDTDEVTKTKQPPMPMCHRKERLHQTKSHKSTTLFLSLSLSHSLAHFLWVSILLCLANNDATLWLWCGQIWLVILPGLSLSRRHKTNVFQSIYRLSSKQIHNTVDIFWPESCIFTEFIFSLSRFHSLILPLFLLHFHLLLFSWVCLFTWTCLV